MATKRYPLLDAKIYHIFSKSIAGFEIFRSNSNYKRMTRLLKYYKTANLVDEPQDWNFSSYKEFLGEIQEDERICNYSGSLYVNPEDYKEFVSSQIDYQQELAKIKELCLDQTTSTP